MRRLLIVVFLAVLWAVGGHSLPVAAFSSDGKQFVSADNVFYAYVKPGETLNVSFKRADFVELLNLVHGDVTITIDGPGATEQQCVAKGDVPVGQGCQFAPITATKAGIWRIQFATPATATPYAQVSPDIKWGGNWFNWSITVNDINGHEAPGRLWTERYAMRQPNPANYTDDLVNYYISEDGYIYRATESGYNGQISILSADAIGIRTGKGCVSAYQSIDVSDTQHSPASGACGDVYKLFFEQPAGDLPTSAVRWDGKTDWVRPNVSHPSISGLKFIADNSKDQLSGTISFSLHNFVGQYQIKIDVNNNGSFDEQNDVTLNEQVKTLANGQQKIHFSGADRQGQTISPSATIGIQVNITKVAEIHLVAEDVEGRTGGLELVRLNGDNAPTTRLCWNDTALSPLTNTALMTPTPDGQNCPDSTGGVHGWAYNDYSWGNDRDIDDWVYASAKLDGTNQVTYPDVATTTVKTAKNPMALIVAAVALGLLVVIILVVVLRARHQRAQKPPQLPPPTDFGTPRY